MKLYLLSHFEQHGTLPEIDKVFVNSCMKILCKKDNRGKKPSLEVQELKNKLTSFYQSEFKPLIKEENLDYTHVGTVLDYLTIGIITTYKNNIKYHYVEYVEKYVNIMLKKKEAINNGDQEAISRIYTQLRKIKNDILKIDGDYESEEKYHEWINYVKTIITPNKNKYEKDNLKYDLHSNPFHYLPCMITMMKEIEQQGVKFNNVFPMRNDIAPHSIKLDTTTLIHLLLTKNHGKKGEFLAEGKLKESEDEIWSFFFKTGKKCFKMTNYSFHHMIETDGVSCSILFLRKDLVGKRIPNEKDGISKEEYIDELSDYSKLRGKKIVGIDPGKSDLLYCVDGVTKTSEKFRYTQDSIRKECKLKRYADIILKFKKEEIDGKTVTEYETELSHFNRKSLNIQKFKDYIQKKSEINHKLFNFYTRYIFRKLKLNGYINRKKHEQKMINRFRETFGSNEKVVVCIGDWEQRKHMKYKEPTKGVGLRKVFRQNGYKVYLVDEFRTSCMCSKCQKEEGRCEKFMKRKNPKPFRSGQILVHGLIKCKSCHVYWNRDVNGATNIYRIAENSINGLNRPDYLCRPKFNHTVLNQLRLTPP